MEALLERLAAANIQLAPMSSSSRHIVFERDGFLALVERTESGFGGVGSAGRLTEKGYASLMWKGGRHYFVAKNYEQPASAEEVEGLRSFQKDLDAALAGPV